MLFKLVNFMPSKIFGNFIIIILTMTLAACGPEITEEKEDTDEFLECSLEYDSADLCDQNETPEEETPEEETPEEETPEEETPEEETPGEETPGEETPGEETPGEETPGEETPGEETPGEETPGEEIPEEEMPVDEEKVVAYCSSFGAQCGAIRDGSGNTLNCGSCDSGETCSSNRCESSCSLEQIDDGPFDGLIGYIPLQFAYEDLSGNDLSVNTTLMPHEEEGLFTFESSVDMTDKKIDIDFDNATVNAPMTLSFKMMAKDKDQSAVLMQSDSFSISEEGGAILSNLQTDNGLISLVNNKSLVKHRSCNHVAIKVEDDKVSSYLNGKVTEMALDFDSFESLAGNLSIGPYPGKVWDVRVFDHALSDSEVKELGEDCDDDNSMPPVNEEFPNYLCGVYKCISWPEGVTDTTQESFEYQLSGHDMTWEHNVLTTGMYVHGELCQEYAKDRTQELDEGYRKSWVSKYNFENPWGQYVLHENFHSFQKRTNGSEKFLAESSASWGAFSMKPTVEDSLLGMYTLQPHLALWTTQDSVFENGIIDESKGGHQYGASIFEFYLTHHVLSDNLIGKVFNRNILNLSPLSGKPAEAMYTVLQESGHDMREVFSDFAARVTTWDMDYGETFLESEIASFKRMDGNNNKAEEPVPSEEVDNKIAEFFDADGTNGEWLAVPSRYKIGSWAYNAYEVDVTENTSYLVGINPSLENPDYAEFRAQAVVFNPETGARNYYKLPVTSAGIATSIDVYVKSGEKLYLVVSSTPSTKFDAFEAYTYDYIITPQ
jgi:hypothetical protein